MTAPTIRTAASTGWAVEARGLGKEYGGVVAVDGIDLEIAPGQFFGLLGPNGAGKTTTIHMLATLLRPSRGTARVAGLDVGKESLAVRRRIGLVFQETTLDLDLTAEENLRFAGRLYGLEAGDLGTRIRDLLALFGLTSRRGDRVRTFSGGMRRALDLARGLLHRPAVLFLDEPTLGLDPIHRRAIWDFLHKLRAEEETTLFLTTHYLEEADGCDRVAIIDGGRIIVEDSPDQLKRTFGVESFELESESVDDELIAEVQRRTGCSAQVTPNGLRIPVQSPEGVLAALAPLIGVRVSSIRIRRATLEDVFVAVSGRTAVLGSP